MLVVPLSAQAYTVENLIDLCKINSSTTKNACKGYIHGVVDGIRMVLTSQHHAAIFCFPEKADANQLRLVLLKWANNNPEDLKDEAAVGIGAAFAESFPCTNNSSN